MMHFYTCTVYKWVFEHHYHVIGHFYGDWTKNLCETSGLGRACNQCIQACLTKGQGPPPPHTALRSWLHGECRRKKSVYIHIKALK